MWDTTFALKVLTNEKRAGLTVAAFDRSPSKLFSLRFSNRSLQVPSYYSAKPVSIICGQELFPINGLVSDCDILFTSYT